MTALEMDKQKYNIVGLKNNSVYSSIQIYLEDKKIKSKNTKQGYEQTIKQFFTYCFTKPITDVTWDDIKSLTKEDIICFRNFLIKSYSNNSVNQKISHIASLFNYFEDKDEKIKSKITKLEKLDFDEVTNSYGTLTSLEIEGLLEFAENQKYRPYMQRMFFETLFVTAIRQNFIFTLTTDDIKHLPDKQSNKNVWVICKYEKGKNNYTAITDDFYEKLCKIREMYPCNDNRFFPLSEKTIAKTLKDYCKFAGISKDRKVVLHSLKKSSGDRVFALTGGNILETARQLKNRPETAMKFYLDKNRRYADQASYNLFNEELDYSILEDLVNENPKELINIIKKAGLSIGKTLIDIAKEQKSYVDGCKQRIINAEEYIPEGMYCYNENKICEFWKDGYCHYLNKKNEYIKDKIKECNVNFKVG